MPQIYVNYKYNKKENKYSILPYDKVYVDLPIAIMQDGVDYDEILVVPINDFMTVVDKEEYLVKNKLFYLKIIKEKVKEVEENEEHDLQVYLPRDTNVSMLRFINNQLVLMEEQKEEKVKKKGDK